jgi:hypothetical protein
MKRSTRRKSRAARLRMLQPQSLARSTALRLRLVRVLLRMLLLIRRCLGSVVHPRTRLPTKTGPRRGRRGRPLGLPSRPPSLQRGHHPSPPPRRQARQSATSLLQRLALIWRSRTPRWKRSSHRPRTAKRRRQTRTTLHLERWSGESEHPSPHTSPMQRRGEGKVASLTLCRPEPSLERRSFYLGLARVVALRHRRRRELRRSASGIGMVALEKL